MDSDELKQRTREFALRIIRLVRAIPKTTDGRAIGSQLVRSGTSVGANYRAACKARSQAEFIAKIGTVEEEADESAFWLDLIIESEMMNPQLVQPLLDEANQLTAIFAQSRKTAKRNKGTHVS